jgi:hypothetical protein
MYIVPSIQYYKEKETQVYGTKQLAPNVFVATKIYAPSRLVKEVVLDNDTVSKA